jgi:hypothetical protein
MLGFWEPHSGVLAPEPLLGTYGVPYQEDWSPDTRFIKAKRSRLVTVNVTVTGYFF